jgi:hypothetical protein
MRIGRISIGTHRGGTWKRYLYPRRLTLKCHPPIYKFLRWYIAIEEEGRI